MGLVFFDTSALVKRYYEESGTETVDELLESDDTVVISSLAIIETVSAFRRKINMGDISEEQANYLLSAFFEEALEDFVIVPIEESVLSFSFDLILQDDLRTLDSLQLSAAHSLDPGEQRLTFVSADEDLVSTARQRGLDARNPVQEQKG